MLNMIKIGYRRCSPSELTYCIKVAMSLTYADTVVTSQSRAIIKGKKFPQKNNTNKRNMFRM